MREEKIAKILLDIGAVMLRPNDPFKYASGGMGPIYCDNRLIMSYPDKRKVVVQAFVDLIKEKNLECDVIAGTATSGIPHAAWIADRLDKPMVYVRGKKKEHGATKLVEGKLEKGQKAVLIEDLINSGGSSITALQGLRDEGAQVKECVAIFSYNTEKSINAFREAHCNLLCLTSLDFLLKVAKDSNTITSDEYELILDWRKSPKDWAQRRGIE